MGSEATNDMSTRKRGAFWEKTSGKGSTFWTGTLTFEGVRHELIMYTNRFKVAGDNQPAFEVFVSLPREPGAPRDHQPPSQRPAQHDAPADRRAAGHQSTQGARVPDDDLPF